MKNNKKNPENIAGAPKKGRKLTRKKRRIISAIAVFAIILSILSAAVMAFFFLKPFAEPNTGNSDILTMPTDDKLKDKVSYFLVAGLDESKSLTDVIMVVCYDIQNKQINIMQIPRDTIVLTDAYSGKINSAYGTAKKGETKINRLISIINSQFGLPIDHYVTVELEAFRTIVDSIGGVDVYLDKELNVESGETYKKGWNHFTGVQAEYFVRHRHSYALADLARMEAQRNFLSALYKKVQSLNAVDLAKVVTTAAGAVGTDMTMSQMMSFASNVKKVDMSSVQSFTLPGESFEHPTYLSSYSVHKAEALEMINQYLVPYGDKIQEKDFHINEFARKNVPKDPIVPETYGSLESH